MMTTTMDYGRPALGVLGCDDEGSIFAPSCNASLPPPPIFATQYYQPPADFSSSSSSTPSHKHPTPPLHSFFPPTSATTTTTFDALPFTCQTEILKYVDLKTLCSAAQVSKGWKKAARDPQLWEHYNNSKLQQCRSEVSVILDSLGGLHTRSFADKSSTERIEFLRSTVELARDYTEKQQTSHAWRLSRNQQSVYALLQAFFAQLRDTSRMLAELASGRYQITCNFDIFETALRRYCEELRTLVPAETLLAREFDRPTANGDWTNLPDPRVVRGIQDTAAMSAWCAAFGPFTALVPFELFYRKVICAAFPKETSTNQRFADHLRYHINFPRDGITSTWRFQILLSTFGPWENLAANFTRFALNPGFVGLVNMIKAEEMLIENLPSLTRNTVLMRYSRRQPEVLAFTSIDLRSRRIEHRRNVDRNGKVVNVAEFLEKVFPGYELARLGLDDSITRVANTFTFARYSNPYTYSQYHTPLPPSSSSASAVAAVGGGGSSASSMSSSTVASAFASVVNNTHNNNTAGPSIFA